MVPFTTQAIMMLLFLSFSVNVLAGQARIHKENDTLKQRTEQVEESTNPLESIMEKVSLGGVLAGYYQYEFAGGSGAGKDRGRGALPVQPEISITPTERDEIFFKFGFAAGKGLNNVTTFNLSPWAADLEDDVKDINGRNRDYLLTAWYKHIFAFDRDHTLGITGGIIDATDYIDKNAFANDEFAQFMNEALVNAPNAFTPSYDIGGTLEWEYNNISITGVGMTIGENDNGDSYTFWGVELGYHLETLLGKGNYRVVYQRTSDDFLTPEGTDHDYRQGYYLSCDQELGSIFGVWIRFGTHDDDAAMDYQNLLTGGINIGGALWGREQDNIGIGYAYLDQGNLDIDKTQLFEAYVRVVLNDIAAVTLDVQYEDDDYTPAIGNGVCGWITGVRMTAEF